MVSPCEARRGWKMLKPVYWFCASDALSSRWLVALRLDLGPSPTLCKSNCHVSCSLEGEQFTMDLTHVKWAILVSAE